MRRHYLLVFIGAIVLVAIWALVRTTKQVPGAGMARPGEPISAASQAAGSNALDPTPGTDQARVAVPSGMANIESQLPDAATSDPQTRLLVVRVVSKVDHAPLASVRVVVHELAGESSSWQDVPGTKGDPTHAPISDAAGQVEFAVPPDTGFRVTASGGELICGGAEIETGALAPGERRQVELELPCGNDLRFHGRVSDRETGLPVPQAKVRLLIDREWFRDGDDDSSSTAVALAEHKTDSSGRFELSLPSWIHPYLRIEADDYGVVLATPLSGHERADLAQELLVSRAATLHALVVDVGGNPLPGTSVRLKAKGYELAARGDHDAFSQEGMVEAGEERWQGDVGVDGRCAISGLPPRVPLEVQIRQGARLLQLDAEKLRLQPGQILERQWTITTGCRIEGLMIDQANKPVPKQEVWLLRRTWPGETYVEPHELGSIAARARTDDHGRFVLEDVAGGAWWLAPAPTWQSGGAPGPNAVATKSQSIEIGSTDRQSITLHVARGLYVTGQVQDPSGRPTGAASVQAMQGSILSREAVVSRGVVKEADGSFTVGPLALGTCSLWADGHNGESPSDNVTAEPGQEGIILRLHAAGTLSGRVVDATSGLPCRAFVYVQPGHPRENLFLSAFQTETQADGTFHLQNLEPDHYHLLFATEDGRFATLTELPVVAGQDSGGHVASISPGGKLNIRYDGKQPRAQFRIICQAAALFPEWVTPDKPSLKSAPAGALIIEYAVGEDENLIPPNPRARTISVTLRAGETREVLLHDDG